MHKVTPASISSFFELLATNLPYIGHIKDEENHFFGFQFKELLDNSRSELKFPCMGLAFRNQSNLPGSFKSSGTASFQRLSVCLLLMGGNSTDEYKDYNESLDSLFKCARFVYDFIEKTASNPEWACKYPVLIALIWIRVLHFLRLMK
jgi:hypothetical protein